ncbi:B12-binding domain-containing radical SAM protein [bacterium]|nr:B12-binding domain-containing radical SAM protein [candidate division CSSED10-310 bacterium]
MSLIATARKNGFEADIAIGTDQYLLRMVRDKKPRVVAFSCVTGIQNWALNICKAIKETIHPDIVTIMGGPHPTFFPEVLSRSPYLDMICVGEGEDVLLDLLHSDTPIQSAENIPNLHVQRDGHIIANPVRPLIQDLDTLPFMERSVYYKYKILGDNPVKRLISGRGCPHGCTFCFNHSMKAMYRSKGSYIRKRSVENILAEIEAIEKHWFVRTFRFEDDLFGVDKDWLLRFCEEYPRRFSTPFICSLRADTIDRDVVEALKNAGCFNVVMGVETGDEGLRNTLLKKHIFDDQLRDAARLFHQYAINFCTTNILGLPGETVEQAIRTLRMTWDLNPTFTWCSVFQPYPRTALGDYVQEHRLVDCLDVDAIEPNYHSGSLLKQPDIRKSVNLHKFFYVLFNHPKLLPVIKPLLGLPPNALYVLIHRISFLLIYRKRWNISLWRAIQEGLSSSGFTRKREKEETCRWS